MISRLSPCIFGWWLILCSSVYADSHVLSRHWHTHLWVGEHSDVAVDVYHLPTGKVRAVGRFSNGLQTIDRKYALGVFVENASGEVWHMIINELVPPSGPGGTQVKWKSDELDINGTIQQVYAQAKILNSKSGTFGLKVDCSFGTQDTKCKWPKPFYKKDKGKTLSTYVALIEKERVKVPVYACAGFPKRELTGDGTCVGSSICTTVCDVFTGEITMDCRAVSAQECAGKIVE